MSDTNWPEQARDGNTEVPGSPAFGDDADDDLLPAGTVLGGYRLVSLLGSGGMGHVFRAEHVRLGRPVAVKVLRPRFAADANAVARFFGEARAVNAIKHEHIIDVADFLELPEGCAYVMELLEGQSLAAALACGPMELPRILDIARQTASALTAVHEAGVVHRDLKPDNIFLTTRGGRSDFVKLLDFGVAKLSPAERATETQAGALLGTPAYMAPEQLRGLPIDHRADIFAFGVILFELLCGRRPFEGASIGAIAVQQITRTHDIVASAPPALAALIRACLDNDPGKRPATMRDIESSLRAFVAAPPEPHEQLAPPQEQSRTPGARRSRAVPAVGMFALAAVLLVIVSAAVTGLALRNHEGPLPGSTAGASGAATDTAAGSADVLAPRVAAPSVVAPSDAVGNDGKRGHDDVPNERAASHAAPSDAAPSDAAPSDATPSDAAPSESAAAALRSGTAAKSARVNSIASAAVTPTTNTASAEGARKHARTEAADHGAKKSDAANHDDSNQDATKNGAQTRGVTLDPFAN